jgi:hypothetical protein
MKTGWSGIIGAFLMKEKDFTDQFFFVAGHALPVLFIRLHGHFIAI